MQDLMTAYGNWNPMAYVNAQDQYHNQYDLANQFANQELAQEAEKLKQSRAMNPLKLEEQQLANYGRQTENQHSNLKYQNSLRDWNNRQAVDPNLEQLATRNKLMSSISDDDIKMAENQIQKMALSNDPRERAAGLQGMSNLKEFVKQREQLLSAQKIASGHDATSLQVAKIGAASRESIAASKTGSGGGESDFEKALLKAKKASEQHAMLLQRAAAVEQQNPDLAASYRARAGAVEPQAKAELQSGGAEVTKIETGPDGRKRLVSVPRAANVPSITQDEQPKPETPKMTMQKLQQMYPGVPPEKLKEAFKRKFGVDVQ